ncbi:hypothetical protein LPJ73_005913, partial [Coemansia sp. RSA 2703]
PAIMNMGRMHAPGNPMGSRGDVPLSPVGPPPGIMSPLGGDAGTANGQQPMQSMMQSRSANSSGRSRFLNHFSGDNAGDSGVGGSSDAADHEAAYSGATNGGMVNGVPPGLPTTGLFGELLRRSKMDAMAAASAAPGHTAGPNASTSPMPVPGGEGMSGGKFVSGRMMLSDIERKLDAARREAQELQAQLSTVIGQNQSAMWALVNGGNVGGSPSTGGDAAPVHQGVAYSGGGSAARK